MKKNTLTLIILLGFIGDISAQISTSLSINDTRSINDLPNFSYRDLRADFKYRNVIGVPGKGVFSANLTLSPWINNDNTGGKNYQLNLNEGGMFYRSGFPLDSQWGVWREIIMASENGNVGIGKINPANKLDVNGIIHSKEVKVDMNDWSDFVFKKQYKLPTLEEVENHIAEKGHLENIPSEKEVLANGINLGEMNAKLLQKIEELTLYAIEQNKLLIDLQNRLEKVEVNTK
ncbi:hypothetical protein [Flavobacterium sp. ov086]|uniref:hypothetical protein n=1 Tax=Flavobacterium sp. ov086 TaxID=1761785 RepID=UPI000B626EBD|nr:hypothetical protein [Flavobacterium sp. ov086]SNR79626.1 hypothetical protein SAMN04487979_1226 [Flavobacterium sp. ov086]